MSDSTIWSIIDMHGLIKSTGLHILGPYEAGMHLFSEQNSSIWRQTAMNSASMQLQYFHNHPLIGPHLGRWITALELPAKLELVSAHPSRL